VSLAVATAESAAWPRPSRRRYARILRRWLSPTHWRAGFVTTKATLARELLRSCAITAVLLRILSALFERLGLAALRSTSWRRRRSSPPPRSPPRWTSRSRSACLTAWSRPESPSRSPGDRSGSCSGSMGWSGSRRPSARPTGPNPAAAVAGRPIPRWTKSLSPGPRCRRRLAQVERRAFDYSDLERGMAQLDLVLRRTRRSLDTLVRGTGGTTGP
jgi:hypothetical protein